MSASTSIAHDALLHRGDDGYAKAVGPVVRSGSADGPVVVAARQLRIDQLRADLGSDADAVEFVDMIEVGRNPTAILPVLVLPYLEQHRGQHVTLVGEPIWPGRSPAASATVVQTESLCNLALAEHDVAVFCTYDVENLPPEAVRDVERTHPFIAVDGERRPSAGFEDPAMWARTCLRPWPAPPGTALTRDLDAAGLGRVRREAAKLAAEAGLSAERTSDLQLAANEVATNSVRHAGATGQLRIWRTAKTLICEVADRGRLSDPLAGRRPAAPDDERGRGLLLANQLCDLVQIDSDRHGTTVRLHFDLC